MKIEPQTKSQFKTKRWMEHSYLEAISLYLIKHNSI